MNRVFFYCILLVFLCVTLAHGETTGYLGGRVIDDVTGEPIKGARISIKRIKRIAKTNGEGYYLIEIPTGTYSVDYTSDGCKDLTQVGLVIRESATTTQDVYLLRDQNSGVEPSLGSVSSGVTVTSTLSSSTGWISGRVRDTGTQVPLEGVHVSMAGLKLEATTDSKGLYLLRNVPVGKYTLRFSCDGYEEKSLELVEIRSNRPSSQSVDLTAAPSSLDVGKKKHGLKLIQSNPTPDEGGVNHSDDNAKEEQLTEEQHQRILDSLREADKTSGIVSGKVTLLDTHGAAAHGYIGIEELKSGTKTDGHGYYVLHVPPGSYTFVYGFSEEYETKRIPGVKVRTGETTKLNVDLSPVK